MPESPAVKTPRLDSVLEADALQQTNALDMELAKVQTFMLNATGLLGMASVIEWLN